MLVRIFVEPGEEDDTRQQRAREAGCQHVATFDQALLREGGFVAP